MQIVCTHRLITEQKDKMRNDDEKKRGKKKSVYIVLHLEVKRFKCHVTLNAH